MSRRNYALCAIAVFALAATALSYALNSKPEDRWASVDNFKHGLPGKLRSSNGASPGFDVTALASELAKFRVKGMPVCAEEEVAADQYVELSAIAVKLSPYSALTLQLNSILDTPEGVSDCQFRIFQWASL